MPPPRARYVLPALLFTLTVTATAGAPDDDERPAERAPSGHKAFGVNVEAPKPTFALGDRAPRVRALKPFQDLVDAAAVGSVLAPPPGTYRGPVLVDKPLTIDGRGRITIDAGDRGTVFVVRADGVTVRGLHLTGSGDSPDTDDSCIDVRGDHNLIESLTIDNCLFGIDLKQSNHNTVRGNSIRSKPLELGMRGDGLRLWYSNDNLIENNRIVETRDMVNWYSSRNVYRGNEGRDSRYSLHFMFANDNVVEYNRFYNNSVGVYLMYSERVHLRHNVISHAQGAAGMAVGFKESSDVDIEDNEIIYCAVGVGSDISPFQPDTTIRFKANRFAFNGISFQFTSELGGNIATDNVFEGNLTNVVQSGRGKANLNEWRGNYWDDYQGFDRNGDGIGDTPYESYAYTDQIWVELPAARFFRNSPVMELLDFLERLAPFSSPELQVRDEAPRFVKPRQSS